MSTTVSNPYSFNIVNNISFSSPTIINNLTIIGNVTFVHGSSKPNRVAQVITRAMSFPVNNGSISFPICGSFKQSNNADISLIMIFINESDHGDIFGANCTIMISSSTNRVKYTAYVEIDNAYRIGVYLGYKINNNVYANANGDHYYQSNIWKKNGSSFSDATVAELIDYIASKNYICNLVSWIEAI